ncbi:MAG: elongation factor Ts [Planctomycetes bacterium]|nr:elongation factor Ts [Planctomycetota bacterium]
MADVSAKVVMELRARTGLGMMECKKALAEAGGDLAKAEEWLRKQGEKVAASKAGREVKEGRIGSYLHHNGKLGVLVEVQCEDDFAARNELFQDFIRKLAMHVAAASPPPVAVTREQIPAHLVEKEREIALAQLDGDPKNAKKPADIKQKIVDGKVNAFYRERVLLEQAWIHDPTQTVEQVFKGLIQKIGQNMVLRRFARLEVGGE